MVQSNFRNDILQFKFNWLAILIFALAFCLFANATVIPDNTTIVGDLTVQSTNGIDINPGSDTTTDLISIGVTGSPKIKWNETQDAIQFIEKLILGTNAILSKTVNGSAYTSKMSLDTDTSTDSGGIDINIHGSSDPSYGVLSVLRSRGTHSSQSIVQSGDLISSIVGLGYDGVDYEPAASIEMYSDGTPGSNDMPGRIDFKTVPDGSRTLTNVMRIGQRSDVMIGTTTSNSSAIFNVESTTKGSRPSPQMTTTQRDAIGTPVTGLSVYNTTLNTYDFYNGTSWLNLLDTSTFQEFSNKTVSGIFKFEESGGGSNYIGFQAPASVTSDVTFQWPDGDGTSGQVMKTNGSGTLSWSNDSSASVSSASEVSNLSIATSVGSSALTIAVKTQSGSNASGGDPINVGIRDATGGYAQRTITAALSLVVSSGSTLGQTSASTARLFIYLIDNAGTLELAVSQTLYPDNQTISTTAEGGAGASDSGTVIYSTTARSNVNFRLVATLQNTQTTAGTWSSAGSNLRLVNSTADAVEPINARYTTNAAQPITNASNTNIIDFEDVSFDSHSAVTTGASWKFTAPVSGVYEAKATISSTSTGNFSGTEYIELKLYKNGSFYSSKYLANFTGSSVQITTTQIDEVALLAGETINFIVYQTSGSSLPLDSAAGYNFVSIRRVGN